MAIIELISRLSGVRGKHKNTESRILFARVAAYELGYQG
jgi:hypothetical protein